MRVERGTAIDCRCDGFIAHFRFRGRDQTMMTIEVHRICVSTGNRHVAGDGRPRQRQRSPRTVAGRCLAALAVVFCAHASAAPINPPLHVLFDPLNVVVSGTLEQADPSGRLVFKREEVVATEPKAEPVPGLIEVAAADWVVDGLDVGGRYLFAYTPYARDPQRVRTMIVNPGGPRLLSSPGLEPALFPDTPAYRRVLAYAKGGQVGAREDSLDTLLGLLTADEAPLRTLAAVQFALDPKLQARLDRQAVRRLKAAAVDPAMSWSGRFWLYDLARRKVDDFGVRWLRRTGQAVLATAPVAGYGSHDNAGDLVSAAFLQADLDGWTVDAPVLRRWLASDSSALAERALVQMRRQDPALEADSLREALARHDLPDGTRQFLADHSRRLARLDTGQTDR